MDYFNEAELVGTVGEILSQGEIYIRVAMHIAREKPGKEDIVTVVIPKIDCPGDIKGKRLMVKGALGNEGTKICVYAKEAKQTSSQDKNQVCFIGTIHKFGKYKKDGMPRMDFTVETKWNDLFPVIPCRVWGNNTRLLRQFKKKDWIAISGSIQYKTYQKYLDNNERVVLKTSEVFIKRLF